MTKTQFEFKESLGNRGAVFFIPKFMDIGYDVHAYFIDFRKAFEAMGYARLISVVARGGLD